MGKSWECLHEIETKKHPGFGAEPGLQIPESSYYIIIIIPHDTFNLLVHCGAPKIGFTWFKTTISLGFIVVITIVRWGYKPTDVPPLAIPRRVKHAFGMAPEARTEASANE